MNKHIVVAIIVMLLFVAGYKVAFSHEDAQIPPGRYESYKKMTMKVVLNVKDKDMGTGVCIAPGVLITVLHVVMTPRGIGKKEKLVLETHVNVFDSLKRQFSGSVISTSKISHLAIVKVPENECGTFVFAYRTTPMEISEPIFSIGHKGGRFSWTFAWGRVAKLPLYPFNDQEAEAFLWTDSSVIPGDSGGGVFDMEGRLVGLVNGTNDGVLGLVIPIENACALSKLPVDVAQKLGCKPSDIRE